MTNDKDINWAIFLKHMRIVAKELRADFQKDLKEAIDPLKENITNITTEITTINKRLEHLEQDVFILIVRTKAMHEQMQAIEKEKLPKIRKSVRKVNKRLKEQEILLSPALAKA